MSKVCTSIEDLPAMLSISQVASALNISRSSAYELAHCKNFPSMLIGSRIIVPKDRLMAWIDNKLSQNELASYKGWNKDMAKRRA